MDKQQAPSFAEGGSYLAFGDGAQVAARAQLHAPLTDGVNVVYCADDLSNL